MGAKSGAGATSRTGDQPMCGSFTPSGSFAIVPGTSPSPFAPPPSSPFSNRIWRPTQMPSTGVPRRMVSSSAPATPLWRIASAHAGIEP